MASTVDTAKASRKTPMRTFATVIFALIAFALLFAANRVAFRMQGMGKISANYGGGVSWGQWLTFVGLSVLAGIAFGVGAISPRRLRYRPIRTVILGLVPLLALVELTLSSGPTTVIVFTQAHFKYLGDLYLHDVTSLYYFVAPVLLGVSIAAGFQSSD
jgi:hypothetical protein